MIDLEFIKRCQSPEFQDTVKKYCYESRWKNDKWKRENPEANRRCHRNYCKTEKGKLACKKRMANRRKRLKAEFDKLGDYDKHLIRQFYNNRPEGMTVDHIIPLSRGGSHHISNLQYLTPEDNARKAYKLDWKPKNQTLTPLLER
jgi:5-methylcytosine-specific restriction endonuclease McrA